MIVPFPFIDTVESKRRPALILSSASHFNNISEASVMAMITSQHMLHGLLIFKITDLISTGLLDFLNTGTYPINLCHRHHYFSVLIKGGKLDKG